VVGSSAGWVGNMLAGVVVARARRGGDGFVFEYLAVTRQKVQHSPSSRARARDALGDDIGALSGTGQSPVAGLAG